MLFSFLSILLSCNNSLEPVSPEDVIDPVNEIVDSGDAALNYRNNCGGCHGQDWAHLWNASGPTAILRTMS